MNPFNLVSKLSTVNQMHETTTETPRVEFDYRDVPELRHETKDVLQQLQSNLSYLEDLGGRLEFNLREVRSLIKR